MPIKVPEASALKVAKLAKQQGLHAVGGVAGLYLQVRGDATSWILRAVIGGRRRDIGLGGYPDVTLADARTAARAKRAMIADGKDPIEERRAAKAKLESVLTFDEAAKRLIKAKTPGWSNPKHIAQWQTTLDTYASPVLGKMPVDKIDIPHILAVLTPIWETKTETATRVRARIEAVLAWATVSKHRTGDNPARWKHNLDKILPEPSKVTTKVHHPALPVDAMPEFMTALRARVAPAARCLELAILTATRSQEVRGARWDEIDMKAATWTIPGARMKAGKEHKVPLSPTAIALLKAQPRQARNPLVFPAERGKVLSDSALSAVLKRMEVPAVPHGFRSTFRDWAAEVSHYPRDVAEMALAHVIQDKTEAAYRRGDLFAKRALMMADWAKYIDRKPGKGTVTPIRRKAG